MKVPVGKPASKAAIEAAPLRSPGRRAARRDPAYAAIEQTLQPGERIEATAYCSAGIGGLGEAGLAALTDRRIVFAPRKGPVRSYAYVQVRGVREEAFVGPQRRIRLALADARPLHLVTGIVRVGADPCDVVRRHCRTA